MPKDIVLRWNLHAAKDSTISYITVEPQSDSLMTRSTLSTFYVNPASVLLSTFIRDLAGARRDFLIDSETFDCAKR